MSDKIKKQIKRSMPWFMIFSLILSTAVAGLVFNFDFKISDAFKKNKDLSFLLDRPMAQADDTASTTVKVRNAPPEIDTPAAESPASTAANPVNVGSALAFTMTADDPEGNSYYLIVCSSDSVIASTTGGPPTCGADQFCLSPLTGDNTQATCVYSDVDDPIPTAETDDWYAFACDNHTTEGACTSPGDDGSGDSGSPLYINHAPAFSAIVTSDNNKNPGGTFTITASTTDNDVARGAEVLHLYACQTNSWATSTGCAVQLCHATSTSPDVDCSFATGTPAVDGNYTYYAFVMDNFNMPAPENTRSSTYHVNNVAPTVTSVELNGNANIQLTLKNSVDGDAVATTSSVSVSDLNGCTDITYATATIYWSSAAGGNNCASDYNNCYRIASTSCLVVPGTCEGSWDSQASYICSTTMSFFAVPTDTSTGNPNEPTYWLGAISVFDEALSGIGTSSAGVVDVITNTALQIDQLDIPYGTVQAGQNTGSSSATTTVINYGNSPLNTYVYGTNMTGPGTIPITEQEHSLTVKFDYGTGTNATSTLPGNLVNTDINRPTSQTNVTDDIYWGINIPPATMSGDYTGVNTFTISLDTSGIGW